MPRRAAPTGASKIKQALFTIAENLGNSKRGLARELGISYYQANKIIEAKKARTPITKWIGERGDVRAYARVVKLERAVEESGYTEREQHRTQRIKGVEKQFTDIAMMPPEAPKDAPFAEPFKSKKYKNGYRESYHVDSSKQIEIPPGAYVQILAKGKGKSHGKTIKGLSTPAATSLVSAFAQYNRYRLQNGFTASSVEIVITKFT